VTIYLAGPMTSYPDLNRPAFQAAYERLRAAGLDVCNPHGIAPHAHDGDCPRSYAVTNGHGAACYLRTCLAALLTCDEIYLLPGWETSVGARLEFQVAASVGMRITLADHAEGLRWRPRSPALT